jgi:hypothetical protein
VPPGDERPASSSWSISLTKNRENGKLVVVWIPSRIFDFEETPPFKTWINSMSHFVRIVFNLCSMFELGGAPVFAVQSEVLENS